MVIRPVALAATSRSGLALAAARPWPRKGVLAARTREVAAAMIDAILVVEAFCCSAAAAAAALAGVFGKGLRYVDVFVAQVFLLLCFCCRGRREREVGDDWTGGCEVEISGFGSGQSAPGIGFWWGRDATSDDDDYLSLSSSALVLGRAA